MSTKFTSFRRLKQAERAVAGSEPSTVADSAIAIPATVAPPAIAESATVAIPPVRPVQPATVEEFATVAIPATLRFVDGRTSIENTVLDSLAEAIPPTQFCVYLRLYRLSRGFRHETCRVGLDRLAESISVSKRTVQDALKRLTALGLVEVVREGRTKKDPSEYRTILPVATMAKSAIEKPAIANPAIARSASNKGFKETHENAPDARAPADVFEIRTIAARLFEAHRGEPGFDHDRLGELVRDALIGHGHAPNADAIEEAIKGMAN